ncbi:branched-chain amino acid aminotransferase [Hutsoniella sourekii]|uniref:branched-chain amino acid aminotransferase n=1 Tax=Hutsoniella sourekii TaxID=87650 RepID=UPI000489FAF5|nr:branched-chain amino acid aminotransferase [Hutsoniella sourekii]
MTKLTPETIQWDQLGFNYIDTGKRFRAYYRDGAWQEGKIEDDRYIKISEGATALHYGQQCFEGLKAYRTKEGKIQLFRPEQNAQRMVDSAERLLMPPYPVEDFVAAVHQVVAANADWMPPYGSGASLYIRPLLIGSGDNIGVGPAPEYLFTIMAMPVGPYFKGGLKPAKFIISDFDRAAPRGTGRQKVGGNYASSLLAGKKAKEAGYADAIYLDPETHTKIEEIGSSNFFVISDNNEFITPKSPSILPGITKRSLLYLAEHELGMKAIEGDIYVKDLDQFVEAGSTGTAAVITPITSITAGDTVYTFYPEDQVGPVTQELYRLLTGIQYGDLQGPEGWVQEVKL